MKMLKRLLGFGVFLLGLQSGGVLGAENGLEIVAELQQGPGNIAVTPEGRLIVSQHQFYEPNYRVVEVLADGTTQPFPNETWSSAPGEDGIGMHAVLGIRSDAEGIVWMLDNGQASTHLPKLVAWDSRTDTLHRVIYIPPPATVSNSFHNDLAIDTLHAAIYLADIAGGDNSAIVVVDLKTGLARRVLEGHPSVRPEDVPMVIDGRPVQQLDEKGQPFQPRVGLNPITIDPQSKWVYYGAMHGTALWRVRTEDLVNAELTYEEIAGRVERYGDKPLSDGISMDGGGNVYITDVTNNAIGVVDTRGKYKVLYKNSELLSWPDAMSYGPDGYFYVAVNQLHRSAFLNAGENLSKPPYYVVRFKSQAPGAVGR